MRNNEKKHTNPPTSFLIKKYNIFPSKRLGQNFLINENISSKIVEECGDLSGKIIIEIGAGIGALTGLLLKTNAKYIYAVEYDKKCIAYLEDLQNEYPDKLKIIKDDVLKIDEQKILQNNKAILISNLPYNISAVLLLKWLEKIYIFEKLVLMFQKEVAERIVALPGNKSYGILSVLTQYLCNARIALCVPPESFFPVPKVDSSVIRIEPKDYAKEKLKLYSKLKVTCKSLFNQRRKMIRSTMKKLTDDPQKLLHKLNLNECLRPENLTIEDFVSITKEIN